MKSPMLLKTALPSIVVVPVKFSDKALLLPATPPVKIPAELYDLAKDIGEKRNLADKYPDVVRRLTAMAKAFDDELRRNKRPPGRVSL